MKKMYITHPKLSYHQHNHYNSAYNFFKQPIASFIGINKHPEYITISAFIIAFDTISTIPFARLRLEGRPKKYAFIRVAGILLNITITFFFLSIFPALYKKHPDSILLFFYSAGFGVGMC